MIASGMGYAALIALLFALAALPAERLLAETGRPRRIAPLAAFAAALAVPAVTLLVTAGTPRGAAGTEPFWTIVAVSLPGFEPTAAPEGADLNRLLLGAWAAASAVLLLALGAAWLRLSLAVRRWPVVATELGPVRIGGSVGPAVFGLRKPSIIVPRALLGAPPEARRMVLAHELEHIVARDHWLVVATRLVTALLPWNLPLWWLARRLRTSVEMDCDARVLRSGIEPAAYCEVLLEMGRRRGRAPLMAAALLETKSELERRIRAMLISKLAPSRRRVCALLAMAALLAACGTQLPPPTLDRSSRNSAGGLLDDLAAHGAEISSRSINVYGPGVALAPGVVSDREVTLLNGDVTIRIPAALRIEGASERLTRSADGDSLILENVHLTQNGITLTSPRAVVRYDGGATILSMDSAALAAAD